MSFHIQIIPPSPSLYLIYPFLPLSLHPLPFLLSNCNISLSLSLSIGAIPPFEPLLPLNSSISRMREVLPMKRFLEEFVTSLDSSTLDLRDNGCRFVHAVVVVADEKTGEVNQATLIRQLDHVEIEERSDEEPSLGPPTSLENADILRALRILEESQEYVASTPIPESPVSY